MFCQWFGTFGIFVHVISIIRVWITSDNVEHKTIGNTAYHLTSMMHMRAYKTVRTSTPWKNQSYKVYIECYEKMLEPSSFG